MPVTSYPSYAPRFENRADLAEALKTLSGCQADALPEELTLMKHRDGKILISGQNISPNGQSTQVVIVIANDSTIYESHYKQNTKGRIFSGQDGYYSELQSIGHSKLNPNQLYLRLSTLEEKGNISVATSK